jgi:hypothetical protein
MTAGSEDGVGRFEGFGLGFLGFEVELASSEASSRVPESVGVVTSGFAGGAGVGAGWVSMGGCGRGWGFGRGWGT